MPYINPEEEMNRREKEWDYFMIPVSLRDKFMRANFIEIQRCLWQKIEDNKKFLEYSRESIKRDNTPVLQRMVA